MNTNDMRMTTSNASRDKGYDSSDVLSLLQVVEQLYIAGRSVINSYSATAIFLSMALELQTLLTKLQAMHKRWSVHLPFKEASSVDFKTWSSRATQMAEEIHRGDCRFCLDTTKDIPSCHCLVDLYDQAKQKSTDTAEEETAVDTDARQMLSCRSVTQKILNDQRTECVDAITAMVATQLSDKHNIDLSSIGDLHSARTICSSLMTELSDLLLQMHNQLVKLIDEHEYERLADRILFEEEYEGPKIRIEAREAVVNWRNGVPMKNLDADRAEQIEQTKEEIRKTRHGAKLELHVDLDADFQQQRSEFGRFLFNRRRDITREELRELILLVYKVYYFQQDAIQEVRQRAGVSAAADEQLPDGETPANPPLPADFSQDLRENEAAVSLFYDILRKIEPYINSAKPEDCTPELLERYKDWTWYHIQAAFEKLGFLPQLANKSDLTRFFNSVFPNRSESSVNRTLYRNTNLNSPQIVADVVKEFEPVKLLIKPKAGK